MLEIKSDYDTTLIAECLSHGDILDCFVCHFVADPVLVPPLLEYGESGVGERASQNSGPKTSFDAELEPTHEAQENASNLASNLAPAYAPAPFNSNTSSHVHSFTAPNTPPPTHQTPTPIHPSTDPTLDHVHSSFDPIPDPVHPSNEQDSDRESLNGGGGGGFNGSDVDDELRSFREEMSKRKRRKRGERAPLHDHVKLGTEKKGQMLGMMNLQVMLSVMMKKRSNKERVKPRRRKKVNRVVFDASSQKVVWELGLVFESVNEFRSAVTKYIVAEHVAIEMYINEPTRTYNPVHKCDPTNRNKLCNSKFLSSHYNERIKEQPDIRIFEFQGLIKKELDLYVGRTVCRRARNKVLHELVGDYVLEFGRILDYKDELLRTNPVKKFFLAGCRRCIGLDGCFLKGVSKGQLLVVVCKDRNNQMLPLAWAVVEVENKFTWAWFVKLLKEDLQLGDGTYLTIISDMQKGLEIAITDHLPNVEHKMCARHILANWSKRWRGLERKKCFWRCARSTVEAELKDNISYMKRLGNNIVDHLLYYNSERWSKLYFNFTSKCDVIDNNMAECFNSWILAARHKTIITMLEEIRVLQDNTTKSMKCSIEWNSDTGKLDPINDISHWYNRETYMKTYNYFIQPVMNLKMWPESQNISVIPPHVRKMPGRPGKKRKKEQGETSKTGKLSKRGIEMSCNTCHNKGHNKRKCPLGASASGTSFTAGPSSRPTVGPSSRPPSGPAAAPTSTQTIGPAAAPTSNTNCWPCCCTNINTNCWPKSNT
ncbi:hypothetical protein KY285_030330 [Solanum tuberosum]|nr:hypothetical protein KY285_030330 [Solanum tuberosum]